MASTINNDNNKYNIPEKIKIGPMYYDIIFNDLSNESLAGKISYYDEQIILSNNKSKGITWNTLLHEIIHGILFNMGERGLSNDEKFIDSLTTHLHSLLKENNFEGLK